MSLRAELVRLGLRWFVKRKIGPATTLEALRRQPRRMAARTSTRFNGIVDVLNRITQQERFPLAPV